MSEPNGTVTRLRPAVLSDVALLARVERALAAEITRLACKKRGGVMVEGDYIRSERALARAREERDAARALILTTPARTPLDAAVQLGLADRVLDDIECQCDDAPRLGKVRRMIASALHVLMEGAGPDAERLVDPDAVAQHEIEFGEVG